MDKTYLAEQKQSQTEVALNIDYGDGEDFDEVTFLVWNVSDPQKAIDKVWRFIQMIHEEMKANDIVPPLEIK